MLYSVGLEYGRNMALLCNSSPRLFRRRNRSISLLTVLMVGILCCSNSRIAIGNHVLSLLSIIDQIALLNHFCVRAFVLVVTLPKIVQWCDDFLTHLHE